jgi:hypothetical protein
MFINFVVKVPAVWKDADDISDAELQLQITSNSTLYIL